MRRRGQICLSCHKDFSRKWNAQRHNDDLHSGEAKIIPINEFLYGRTETKKLTTSDNHNLPNQDKDLVYILDMIGEEFEEFEHFLQFLPEEERISVLGQEILLAMGSANPKKYMLRSLRAYRSGHLLGKMINYLTKYWNQPRQDVIKRLTAMVKAQQNS